MRLVLLLALLAPTLALAADKTATTKAVVVSYACAWSTKTVTFVDASSEDGATTACKAAPPSKDANLEFVKAPDKNGKHGDILIDGVKIDYD